MASMAAMAGRSSELPAAVKPHKTQAPGYRQNERIGGIGIENVTVSFDEPANDAKDQ